MTGHPKPLGGPRGGLRSAAVLLAAAAAGAAGSVLAGPAAPAAAPPAGKVRQPEATAGPYRVVVERISQSRSLTLRYPSAPAAPEGAGGPGGPELQARRNMQLQLAIYAPEGTAGVALAGFQVNTVTVTDERRTSRLPHYGGLLDDDDDGAALRAYLYLPRVPPLAREIRAVEGEIVAYERAAEPDLLLPTDGGPLPRSVEQNGVRATLHELRTQGTSTSLVLTVAASGSGSVITAAVSGRYGVLLLDSRNREASPAGGSVNQPRPNLVEFRLNYQQARGGPKAVRVRVLHRSGSRRVHRFRLERLPIPSRPSGGAAGTRPAGG